MKEEREQSKMLVMIFMIFMVDAFCCVDNTVDGRDTAGTNIHVTFIKSSLFLISRNAAMLQCTDRRPTGTEHLPNLLTSVSRHSKTQVLR